MKQKLPSTRWLAGKKAQKNGANFEDMIREQCKAQNIILIKNNVPTRWTVKGIKYCERSEPDFCIGFQGISVYFDAKSFDSDRIIYSQLVTHQIARLAELEAAGFNAGYIVWMRQTGDVAWIPVGDLLNLKPGCSIQRHQMTIIGTSQPGWHEPEMVFGRLFSLDWEQRKCWNCKKTI